MFREYFISLYFQILKKRLHRMRLSFFMDLGAFESSIKTHEFSYTEGGSLERIMHSYARIMKTIEKVEGVEKYMEKGDIFDNTFYMQQLHRDILAILVHIEASLYQRLTELQSTQQASCESPTQSSYGKNISLQKDRINLLVIEVKQAIERIHALIVQLNNTIVALSTRSLES